MSSNDNMSTTRRGTPYRKPEEQAEEMGGHGEVVEDAVISDQEFQKRAEAELRDLLEQAKEARELALVDARGQLIADEEEQRQRRVKEGEERLEMMRQEIAWLEGETKKAGRELEAAEARRVAMHPRERRPSPEVSADAFFTPHGLDDEPRGLVGRGESVKSMPRPPNQRVVREELLSRGL